MGTLQYGKLFDLRYEDFLIVLLIISWLLYSAFKPQKLYLSPLWKPVLVYLSVAFISTFIGLWAGWIELVRAFFFYFKEVEYFFFFIITINFIKDYKGLKYAIVAFLTGGVINGVYVFYQIVSGNIGRGVGDLSDVYRHYGIATIGETSSAIVGNYFSMIIILCAIVFIFISEKSIKLISFICIPLSFLGLIGSFNRSSVWGTIFLLPVWFYFIFFSNKKYSKKYQSIAILILLVLVIPLLFGMVKEDPFSERILNINTLIEAYKNERFNEVYINYFKAIAISPITGLGKSITGDLSIIQDLYGTAHNQYIGILSEMGIIGLLVFLYLIWLVIKFSYKTYRDGYSPFCKIIGLTSLMWTILLCIESFACDAFIAAKTAESYWILVGLLMVTYQFNWLETYSKVKG
ncbi:MAG: O-antigen ligase family protein [Nitrospirota bacterium]